MGYGAFADSLIDIGYLYGYSTFFMNSATYKSLLGSDRMQEFPHDINKQVRDYYEYVSKRVEDNNDIVDAIALRYYNEYHPFCLIINGGRNPCPKRRHGGFLPMTTPKVTIQVWGFYHQTVALHDRTGVHMNQVEQYQEIRDALEQMLLNYAEELLGETAHLGFRGSGRCLADDRAQWKWGQRSAFAASNFAPNTLQTVSASLGFPFDFLQDFDGGDGPGVLFQMPHYECLPSSIWPLFSALIPRNRSAWFSAMSCGCIPMHDSSKGVQFTLSAPGALKVLPSAFWAVTQLAKRSAMAPKAAIIDGRDTRCGASSIGCWSLNIQPQDRHRPENFGALGRKGEGDKGQNKQRHRPRLRRRRPAQANQQQQRKPSYFVAPLQDFRVGAVQGFTAAAHGHVGPPFCIVSPMPPNPAPSGWLLSKVQDHRLSLMEELSAAFTL